MLMGILYSFVLCRFLLFWSAFLIVSNLLFSLVASSIAFCYLCTFTLLAQLSTCSLVILLVFFITVILLMISILILLSLMPSMNCSFNLLSLSLYLHSFALTCRQPTHSSAFFFSSLIGFWYWSDNILSLC